MASKGSKNDSRNRGKGALSRLYQGKIVKPVVYKGYRVGDGNYVGAQYEDGKLVLDAEGRPLPYSSIPAQ